MDTVVSKMLNKLREGKFKKMDEAAKPFIMEREEKDNFITRSKILMEEAVGGAQEYYVIDANTPQFGDVRASQEDMLKKTIGEHVTLESDALKYYKNLDDLALSGKINSLKLAFQFWYQDPDGDGCYIWADKMRLSDENTRTIGKIRDAFVNWKNSIDQDGDLMPRLKKMSSQQ